MNTKQNEVKTPQKTKKHIGDLKCSLCEEKFSEINDLEEHMNQHLVDIKEMDIDHIKSGHDLYECTLCAFESGHNDSIREHLIEHVLASKSTKNKCDHNKDGTADKEE